MSGTQPPARVQLRGPVDERQSARARQMDRKSATDQKSRVNARVKIEDVARKAAVSPATVSRVLNHPEIVRPELREKVARAIADLSYTRDSAGRALKSGRMRTIGAIVPTLGLGIFA